MLTPDQVKEQVERLCESVLPLRQADLLRFLISLKAKDFETRESKDILLEFDEKYPSKSRGHNRKQTPLDRVRRLVCDLSRSLERYYVNLAKLSTAAPDRVWIQIEVPKNTGDHRYEPKIGDWPPKKETDHNKQFRIVGDNQAALDHVARQIPKLNRIEEACVRWVDRVPSLYAPRVFNRFLDALKDSNLLYRAVLGPITDPAVSELREVLASRISNSPEGKAPSKVYRLLHGTALMDFTLLYYVEEGKDFYSKTNKVEVLFGYGVHQESDRAESTVVFGSMEEELVEEFRQLFKVLRSKRFSRRLDLSQPEQFHNEPRQCDVVATFPRLPEEELLRRIRASGTGEVVNRGGKKPHIKICVSALKFLDHTTLRDDLKQALDRGVQVSIALWAQGMFITTRTRVIGISRSDALREMEGSRSAIKFLGKHENLSKRWCTGEAGSVSIIWIDELIYFSAYWVGKNVADGPHFLTLADSETGKYLQAQYDEMLKTSKPWED